MAKQLTGNEGRGNFTNHKTKISDEDVKFIRENYIPNDREWGGAALGRKFGIGRSQVSMIINNKTRKQKENNNERNMETSKRLG